MLRLGNIVPDFTATSTQGEIHWHDWIDGKWAILFSHPADFTCVLFQTIDPALSLHARLSAMILAPQAANHTLCHTISDIHT